MIQTDYFLKIDWLAFTFCPVGLPSGSMPVDVFPSVFPELAKILLEDSTPCKIKSHYTNTLQWNNDIIFSFNVFKPDCTPSAHAMMVSQGVNVQVPSHSLPIFFKLFDIDIDNDYAIPKFFELLEARSSHVSRLDLCFDDHNYRNTYTAFDYAKMYFDDKIQTRFHPTTMGSRADGMTVYFGSLKTRTKLLRIYDKFLESKGNNDCVRYEFEYHGVEARDLARFICTECPTGLDFTKFISNFFTVKCTGYTRIQDAVIDPEWQNFLLWGTRFPDDYYFEDFASIYGIEEEDVKLRFNAILSITLPRLMKYKIPHYEKDKYKDDLNYFINNNAAGVVAGYCLVYGEEALLEHARKNIKRGFVSDKYQREYRKLQSSFNTLYDNLEKAEKSVFSFQRADDNLISMFNLK